MKKDKKIVALFVLSICGFLFSGYMSGVKFFTHTCAFSEPCPYFLGHPACYYGFTMFLLLLVLSFALVFSLISQKMAVKGIIGMVIVSLAGVLFAGYFTFREIPSLFTKGFGAYFLGLPTCALGLIFFVAIFIVSIISYRNAHRQAKIA